MYSTVVEGGVVKELRPMGSACCAASAASDTPRDGQSERGPMPAISRPRQVCYTSVRNLSPELVQYNFQRQLIKQHLRPRAEISLLDEKVWLHDVYRVLSTEGDRAMMESGEDAGRRRPATASSAVVDPLFIFEVLKHSLKSREANRGRTDAFPPVE